MHSDIIDHVKTKRYKHHEEASASASQMSSYFKKTMPKDDNLTPAMTEGALTHHAGNDDFSFRSKIVFSRLILLIFNSQFFLLIYEKTFTNVFMPLPEELH